MAGNEEESEETAPEPTATKRIEKFRAQVEEAKNLAILEPTRENLQAYMEINLQMAQMAGRFADVWQRVLFDTPRLDANTRRPLTQIGTNSFNDNQVALRQAALKRAAGEAGLLFITQSADTCLLCPLQAEILTAIRDNYNIEILAVSADGRTVPGFPKAVPDEGQLDAMGIAGLPRPLVVIAEPSENRVRLLGAGLLTEDQIIERIHVVRDIPEGKRYQ